MTTAPSRPLVHSYEPNKNPMELVDTPSGPMERWRADALLVGETSALADISKQIREDAVARMDAIEAREAELNARDDAISARERQHAVSVARFTDFVGKASVLFDRLEKARADQEREPIAHPPGSAATESAAARPIIKTNYRSHHLKWKGTKVEFPDPELTKPPATHPQPIAAGLDDK
jgi:hypothetical protein